MMLRQPYIVIEGNIGAGKTSLAHLVAEHFKGELVLEEFADNAFLPQFYKDPERFGFPLEMSFMAERYQQLKKIFETQNENKPVISDYLFEKSLLFAKVNLKEDEFGLFEKFFKLVNESIPSPDLLVFLQKDVSDLKKNIEKRGRAYEKEINTDYLNKIKIAYDLFLSENTTFKKIIIPSSSLDFVTDKKDFEFILGKIVGFLKQSLV